MKICIRIANKRQHDCESGVGFRCGVFDCTLDGPPNPGKSTERLQPLIYEYINGSVIVKFTNKIDWDTLSH